MPIILNTKMYTVYLLSNTHTHPLHIHTQAIFIHVVCQTDSLVGAGFTTQKYLACVVVYFAELCLCLALRESKQVVVKREGDVDK